jgi:hypothetical protein
LDAERCKREIKHTPILKFVVFALKLDRQSKVYNLDGGINQHIEKKMRDQIIQKRKKTINQ